MKKNIRLTYLLHIGDDAHILLNSNHVDTRFINSNFCKMNHFGND